MRRPGRAGDGTGANAGGRARQRRNHPGLTCLPRGDSWVCPGVEQTLYYPNPQIPHPVFT